MRLPSPGNSGRRDARAQERCEMVFLGMRMTRLEDAHSRLEEAPDRFFDSRNDVCNHLIACYSLFPIITLLSLITIHRSAVTQLFNISFGFSVTRSHSYFICIFVFTCILFFTFFYCILFPFSICTFSSRYLS